MLLDFEFSSVSDLVGLMVAIFTMEAVRVIECIDYIFLAFNKARKSFRNSLLRHFVRF